MIEVDRDSLASVVSLPLPANSKTLDASGQLEANSTMQMLVSTN